MHCSSERCTFFGAMLLSCRSRALKLQSAAPFLASCSVVPGPTINQLQRTIKKLSGGPVLESFVLNELVAES